MKDNVEQPSFAQNVIDLMQKVEKYRVDIERALSYGVAGLGYDEVCARILKGQYHFYPLPNSVMIMEVVHYEDYKVYHGVIAAGDFEEIAAMHEPIKAIAKGLGCTKLALSGRRGWLRAFKPYGWREQQTVIELPLDDDTQLDTQVGEEH